MSIETRREMLVRYLREHGRTSVNDLAAHFNITGATVRSDLRHLEQAQLVVRRYGGAEAFTQPALEDHSMDEKTVLNLNTKQRIGGRYLGFSEPGIIAAESPTRRASRASTAASTSAPR